MPGADDELTYAKAGVDFDRESAAIKALVRTLGGTRSGGGARPLDLPGHFAGAVRIGDLALVLCTDGVGTKMLVAQAMGRWDTVGIDCIAMNVNDAVCIGAEPVAFVDYLAVNHAEPDVMAAIGRGLAEGARQANVAIVGGETATLPEMVHGYDLAGTCLAVAPVDRLVLGTATAPGDVLIGLPSSGIHSNGLTLARKAVAQAGLALTDTAPELEGARIGDALLTPTRIYVKDVLRALERVEVHGLAHVTGGGVLNVPRINPAHHYVLERMPEPPAVFRLVQRLARASEREMHKTFNMGVGFVLAVPASAEDDALQALASAGAFRLGRVEAGRAGVRIPERKLEYEGAKGH